MKSTVGMLTDNYAVIIMNISLRYKKKKYISSTESDLENKVWQN